jgi:hypothetical protein
MCPGNRKDPLLVFQEFIFLAETAPVPSTGKKNFLSKRNQQDKGNSV